MRFDVVMLSQVQQLVVVALDIALQGMPTTIKE
jgi:hypothetical protein